ncbi:MAG: sulfatase [Pseudomonadota bacterium]
MVKNRPTRRYVNKGLASTALLAASGSSCARVDRPNILLIVSDDLGTQLGCYGDKIAHTPTIDQLARDGVRFVNAYVTQSSCSSSRSSILTGLYPHQNGQTGLANHGYKLRAGVPLLPNLLHDRGYFTSAIGKLHVIAQEEWAFDHNISQNVAVRTRDVNFVLTEMNKALDKATTAKKPFFIQLSLFDPHRPYESTSQGLPIKTYTKDDVEPFRFSYLGDGINEDVAGFYTALSRADAITAETLNLLRDRNILKNTLIIFLGDHGPPFWRAKTTCYESGIRIPLIFSMPGSLPSGMVVNELVSTISLLPTLLDFAGSTDKPPLNWTTPSLLPLLTNTAKNWSDILFAEFTAHAKTLYLPQRAVRRGRHKLILSAKKGTRDVRHIGTIGAKTARKIAYGAHSGTHQYASVHRLALDPPRFQLFDLVDDPYEAGNLATSDQYANVITELEGLILSWQQETNDPLLAEFHPS